MDQWTTKKANLFPRIKVEMNQETPMNNAWHDRRCLSTGKLFTKQQREYQFRCIISKIGTHAGTIWCNIVHGNSGGRESPKPEILYDKIDIPVSGNVQNTTCRFVAASFARDRQAMPLERSLRAEMAACHAGTRCNVPSPAMGVCRASAAVLTGMPTHGDPRRLYLIKEASEP